jgi:signal peptidase I
VAIVLGCLIAAMLVDTWLLAGLFVPLTVRGGSMAPALRGAHRLWHCERCAGTFACDLESLPQDRAAICPDCGAAHDADRGADRLGDRLFIDRSAFCWRQPKRWETIVLRRPDESAELAVKRVVGLPGETIGIDDGDIVVDGTVAAKDLSELRAMAVAVAGPEATDRWHGAGHWRLEGTRFVHDRRAAGEVDWLSYRHVEHLVQGGDAATGILDDSTFDQNESRQLNSVADVLLSLQLEAAGSGYVLLHATSRGDEFRVELNTASGQLRLLHDGRPVQHADVGPRLLDRPTRVEFAVADRRVQLAFAGRTLVEYEYQPATSPGDRTAPRLAIGARDSQARVGNIQVLRDVHYLPGEASQYRLGNQEYLVLGDNSPHSVDSRSWSPGGVHASALLGPVLSR